MLAPQFSLRKLLFFTVLCCLFAYLISMAVRGEQWALPFVIVGIAAVTAMVLYAVFFLIGWIFSLLLKDRRRKPNTESPFASDRPAPQILPPDHTL